MEKKSPGYLIYAGPREGKDTSFQYYRLKDLKLNDGKNSETDLVPFLSDTKLFKQSSIGAIYAVDFKGDSTVSYNKNTRPGAYWLNDDDRTRWKALETAAQEAKELKTKISTNTMIATLQPIREAYRESSTAGRRAILAEALRIITT